VDVRITVALGSAPEGRNLDRPTVGRRDDAVVGEARVVEASVLNDVLGDVLDVLDDVLIIVISYPPINF